MIKLYGINYIFISIIFLICCELVLHKQTELNWHQTHLLGLLQKDINLFFFFSKTQTILNKNVVDCSENTFTISSLM